MVTVWMMMGLAQAGEVETGLILETLSMHQRWHLGVPSGGLWVEAVHPGSFADDAELEDGDVLLRADAQRLYHPDQLWEIATAHEGELLWLTVLRDDAIIHLEIEIPEDAPEYILIESQEEEIQRLEARIRQLEGKQAED